MALLFAVDEPLNADNEVTGADALEELGRPLDLIHDQVSGLGALRGEDAIQIGHVTWELVCVWRCEAGEHDDRNGWLGTLPREARGGGCFPLIGLGNVNRDQNW